MKAFHGTTSKSYSLTERYESVGAGGFAVETPRRRCRFGKGRRKPLLILSAGAAKEHG
jgi:hypothetical protein